MGIGWVVGWLTLPWWQLRLRRSRESCRGGSCNSKWRTTCFRGCHTLRNSCHSRHQSHKSCSKRRRICGWRAAGSSSAKTSTFSSSRWRGAPLRFDLYSCRQSKLFPSERLPTHYKPKADSIIKKHKIKGQSVYRKNEKSLNRGNLLTLMRTVSTVHEFFSTS